jgi:hypothetical protein
MHEANRKLHNKQEIAVTLTKITKMANLDTWESFPTILPLIFNLAAKGN